MEDLKKFRELVRDPERLAYIIVKAVVDNVKESVRDDEKVVMLNVIDEVYRIVHSIVKALYENMPLIERELDN